MVDGVIGDGINDTGVTAGATGKAIDVIDDC